MIDFTDSASPTEIAWFDRGPIEAEHLVLGGYWSAYFYDGRIYGTEIVRGLDVFELAPSEYLSANEIAAAAVAKQGAAFNPQQQFRVDWPAEPVVALAYLDQLLRAGELPEALAAQLSTALEAAGSRLDDGRSDTDLSASLRSLAGDASTSRRIDGLADTLLGLASRL